MEKQQVAILNDVLYLKDEKNTIFKLSPQNEWEIVVWVPEEEVAYNPDLKFQDLGGRFIDFGIHKVIKIVDTKTQRIPEQFASIQGVEKKKRAPPANPPSKKQKKESSSHDVESLPSLPDLTSPPVLERQQALASPVDVIEIN